MIITGVISIATTIVHTLAVGTLAVQGLKIIGNVLLNLGKALGLIKKEIKVDELGDKALQSGYHPENFNSYEEYYKAVEDFNRLDPEKSKQIPEEDKIKKGMELVSGVISERFKEFPVQDFCISIGQNPDFFTEARLQEIGKLINEDGGYIPQILNYMNGREKDEIKLSQIIDTLVSIEKSVNPGISDKDAVKNVLQIRG